MLQQRPAVTSSEIIMLVASQGAVSELSSLTCAGAGAGAVPGIGAGVRVSHNPCTVHYSGDAG